MKLGPLGNAARSAALATRTPLFVTIGDQVNARTWEIELEAGATGAPMTCMHKNRQSVVFAIGGQHPAEFVALSLP